MEEFSLDVPKNHSRIRKHRIFSFGDPNPHKIQFFLFDDNKLYFHSKIRESSSISKKGALAYLPKLIQEEILSLIEVNLTFFTRLHKYSEKELFSHFCLAFDYLFRPFFHGRRLISDSGEINEDKFQAFTGIDDRKLERCKKRGCLFSRLVYLGWWKQERFSLVFSRVDEYFKESLELGKNEMPDDSFDDDSFDDESVDDDSFHGEHFPLSDTAHDNRY